MKTRGVGKERRNTVGNAGSWHELNWRRKREKADQRQALGHYNFKAALHIGN